MKINRTVFIGTLLISLAACNNEATTDKESIDSEILDPKSALNTNFDGKIFSIPSPILTAMLIKKASKTFYGELLNPYKNSDKYTTEYARALNLGIYGTDLGYSSLYDQKAVSINYLSTVEKITNSLGLEGAFDKNFMTRYEENASNQDSMMIIVSDAYKKADLFLKNSDRKTTSSLILTGGWIESMYFACQLTAKNKNTEIIERIAEQKQTLITIIEILTEYNKKGTNDALIAQLEDLLISFEAIKMNYTYVAPETNASKKTTTLKHSISFDVSDKTLKEITEKLTLIRTSIIS